MYSNLQPWPKAFGAEINNLKHYLWYSNWFLSDIQRVPRTYQKEPIIISMNGTISCSIVLNKNEKTVAHWIILCILYLIYIIIDIKVESRLGFENIYLFV